jgi:hypothetical protein
LKSREKFLAFSDWADCVARMIQSGFLNEQDRGELIVLARNGSSRSRVTRRANALVLLDAGWSCQEVAKAFLLDDDTIRGWRKLFAQRGIEQAFSHCHTGVKRSDLHSFVASRKGWIVE